MGVANPVEMPTCPQCGAELGSADPAGLCPICLIQGALESSSGVDESRPQTIGPIAVARDDDFGRYQIIRPVGEGGMGTVYLAEQREPIRRRVALKVVKLGMDTSQVLARFDNERQALAMMDHPNIAQIFDAGATTKGRPYFVMEYIEGAPITHYCDRQRMTIKERLALFLSVCRAVQHAHQKGVIHRDLKPSNVLVMEQDGAPMPKVIDFGIATATDKWTVERTLLTQFGQIVGTPEYASPEQADTITGDVDESSDVYSLGVLLYELLIGAVPFDTATLRNAGLAEMLRIIREDEAPSLSRKLTSMGTAATDIAARRQTDPISLGRLLTNDLNSIAMKALEKSRERRYGAVSDLAADIQRFTEDRPVLASPRGRLYRTRKFLHRNRPAAIGTAAGLVFFLVLSGVTAWSLLHRDPATLPKLTGTDTIVLADFDNKTGDPVFDGTLRQGLSVEFQQSPFINLISDRQVQQQLALMGQPKEARLTSEVAQQVCERTASAMVVEGSIASLGSQYVLGLRARNCNTGSVIDQEQVQVAKREDVLNSLSQVARKFRTQVGESLSTVEKHSTPLAQATTLSLEALKAYSTGLKMALSSGNAAAIPLFRRAVEIDPKFAMAYANLGLSYSAIGESVLSAESTTSAWQLRDRVSDRERFFIDFTYDRQVTGNLEKAYQTLELWLQTYPRGEQPSAQSLLGGLATHGTGRYERAIEAAQKGIADDPDLALAYASLAQSYFLTGRFPEAERTLQRASERKLEMPEFLVIRYNVALLKGDKEQMAGAVGLARGKRRAEHWIAHQEALALARSGRFQAARRSSNRGVDLALQEGERESASSYRAARAVWEAVCGNAAEAKRNAVAALELSKGRDVEYAAGLALALSGDWARSETLAADLEKRFPEDTFAKFDYVPVLRALAALGRGRPTDSVELLEIALPYELAANGLNFNHYYLGGLHSAYVRGEALIAAERYAEAADEFQKIVEHRGIVGADPIGAVANLQLGRVFALLGDKTKAKAAYEAFLALWKDADPDIPILKRAKVEYARL
jgi:serine/threonine protein kinase/tetratricopeptide (TPR) repeat protein